MLSHVDMWCRQEIIEKLHGQVVRLSQHKFASNVIEKCLQYGDSNSRQVSSLCLTTALASFNRTCFIQQKLRHFCLLAQTVLADIDLMPYVMQCRNMSACCCASRCIKCFSSF